MLIDLILLFSNFSFFTIIVVVRNWKKCYRLGRFKSRFDAIAERFTQ